MEQFSGGAALPAPPCLHPVPKACSRLQLEQGGTTSGGMGMEGKETGQRFKQEYFTHNLCLYERKEHMWPASTKQ